ncbi:MAG: FecR domain-containing protein [Proteiniphilum sp.]
MNNRNQIPQNAKEILLNEEFIRWRIFRTKESTNYWENFRKSDPQLESELLKAIRLFDAVQLNRFILPSTDKQEIYRSILNQATRHKRRKKVMLWAGSSAALFLIALLSLLFTIQIKREQSIHAPNHESILGATLPSEEIYLISGDKMTQLAQNTHIALTKEGKAVITDSSSHARELLLADTDLNKLVVPKGKRSNLTLADGTELWLNSGTELEFPRTFAGKRREIRVDGEIYLDVAHNPEIPFVVHAQEVDIIVQGTAFNITAYSEDTRKSVVLVEGKVRVETGNKLTAEMLPNEKIDIVGNNLSKKMVDVTEYISWKNGVLVFNSTPMSEILKKVGRYYNVQFDGSTDQRLNKQTCTGKLFLSNNLDSVMTSVSILSSTVYHREGEIIHINKKNP